MSAEIIDGKAVAADIKRQIAAEVAALGESGIKVKLCVIFVGDDPASQVYVKSKARDCSEVGIESDTVRLPASTETVELLELIDRLNRDDSVNGILVQLPLPRGIDKDAVIDAISPRKDVDCFVPHNAGLLFAGRQLFEPCTPAGVVEMLKRRGTPIKGARCVIIGRSDIVGKPLALMMTALDATVTLCHSKTNNISEIAKSADILVAAVGRPRFVTGDMVKEGATVVDVGINRLDDGTLCGDVDFESVSQKAAAITPVPGGVGLMTRAMLLKNTVRAARLAAGIL